MVTWAVIASTNVFLSTLALIRMGPSSLTSLHHAVMSNAAIARASSVPSIPSPALNAIPSVIPEHSAIQQFPEEVTQQPRAPEKTNVVTLGVMAWHFLSLAGLATVCIRHIASKYNGASEKSKLLPLSGDVGKVAMAASTAEKCSISIGAREFLSNDVNDDELALYATQPQLPTGSRMHPILITFVRHGETAENASGTIQGWTPTDLNEFGFQQAEACAAWMKTNYSDICAIVTSDLPRAKSTAEAIHRAFDNKLPFKVTASLRERRLGIFETKLSKEARAYDPEVAKQFKGPIFYDMISDKHPETEVETRNEFIARAKDALQEVFKLGAQYAAQQSGAGPSKVPHLMVVSHGQIIRIMTSLLLVNPHLLPKEPEDMTNFYKPNQQIGSQFTWSGDKLANTSLTRIVLQVEEPRQDGEPLFFTPPTLIARNVVPHLQKVAVLTVSDERGGE